MRVILRFFIRAVPILAVGMAFFVCGCQPKTLLEPSPRVVREPSPARDPMIMAGQAFQAGDYHSALKAFQQVLAENPNHSRAGLIRYQIAYCLFQIGSYQEALSELQDWLNRFPDHPLSGQALFLIGRSYQASKEPDRAFEWYIKALKWYDPSHIKRHEIEAAVTALISEADIIQLERMVRQTDEKEFVPQIYYRITSRLLEQNSLDEAKKAAMKMIRSSRDQYWVSLGRRLLDRIERELSPKEGVLGCLLPLTGPYAIYGQETLNGIQLGLDMFNSSGTDISLDLFIRDTAGDADRTRAAIEELAAKVDLMALIGPLASHPATVAVQKARELEIPIIILTQKQGLVDQGGMVFRNFLTPLKEIEGLVDLAMDKLEIKRFGILYPDNSYGRYFMNLFWDQLDEKGGVVRAVESYPPGETDFGDQIKRMTGLYYPRPESIARLLEEMKREKASLVYEVPLETTAKEGQIEEKEEDEEPEPFIDFEAVFIPDNYNQVALIAPQFPFHRVFQVQLLGTSLWHSQELIDNAADYIQGAVFPAGFYKDRDSEKVWQFVEAYRDAFDSEPGLLAATGYDTIRLLSRIFEKNKIMNRGDVRTSLSLIEDFQGVTGQISFDDQGEVEKPPLFLTVAGNEFKVVTLER